MSAARRQTIEVLTTEHRLSVRRACRVVGLARATWYAAPVDPAVRDAAVIDALQALIEEHPRWGFWKCYDRLRLDGHPWNHKRLHRVYVARLNLPRRTRRRVPPRFRQPLVAPTRLNEVWALDFMHDALYGGRRFRTLNVLDEGNREAWLSKSARRYPIVEVLKNGGPIHRYASHFRFGRRKAEMILTCATLLRNFGWSSDEERLQFEPLVVVDPTRQLEVHVCVEMHPDFEYSTGAIIERPWLRLSVVESDNLHIGLGVAKCRALWAVRTQLLAWVDRRALPSLVAVIDAVEGEQ